MQGLCLTYQRTVSNMATLRQLLETSTCIDLETTITTTLFGNSPMPWFNNDVVAIEAIVELFDGDDPNRCKGAQFYRDAIPNFTLTLQELDGVLLVGHNVKFDLAHMIYGCMTELINNGHTPQETLANIHKLLSTIQVWDTMIAEYYLSDQEVSSPSLEYCCESYGIPFTKDETVSESFKLGLGADKIDKDTLLQYLHEDVVNTSLLFRKQIERAYQKGGAGYVRFLIHMMGATVATVQAEVYGIALNQATLNEEAQEIRDELSDCEARLNNIIKRVLSPPSGLGTLEKSNVTISPTSNKTVGLVLYGGDIELHTQVPILNTQGNPVVYKSGKKKGEQRYKKGKQIYHAMGLLDRAEHYIPKPSEEKVDEKTLQQLLLYVENGINTFTGKPPCYLRILEEFLETLLVFRQLNKDLGTYFDGIPKYADKYGLVHPNFNHAITKTKRLTGSSPNFQNMSNKTSQVDDDGD